MADEKVGTIELFSGYVVRVDRYNYTLAKAVTAKNGKMDYVIYGYYGRLPEALNAFRDRLVTEGLQSACTDLTGAVRTIQEVCAAVEQFVADRFLEARE